MQPTQLPGLSQLDGVDEVRDVAPLRPRLKHAAGATNRVGQALRLGDRHRARLLRIHVLAGLGGQHGGRRVPTVAGGDQHCVDVVSRQQLAEVAVGGAGAVAVLCVGHSLDRLAPIRPNVGDGREVHARLVEHVTQNKPAAVADANAAQHNPLAGRDGAVFPQSTPRRNRRERQRTRCGTSPFQQLPACDRMGSLADFHSGSGSLVSVTPCCGFVRPLIVPK